MIQPSFLIFLVFISVSFSEFSCKGENRYPEQKFFLPNCKVSPEVQLEDSHVIKNPDFEFDKVIRPHADPNGVIIVSSANYAHLEIAVNFVLGLKRQNITNYFIFCYDAMICKEFQSRKIPSALIPKSWNPLDFPETEQEVKGSHDKNYLALIQTRSFLIQQLLALKYTVLFADVDIVFPNPGFYSDLMNLVSSKHEVELFFSQTIPYSKFLLPYVNAGFFLILPKPTAILLFERYSAQALKRKEVMDQNLLNEVMDLMGLKINGVLSRKVHFLSDLLYASGWNIFGKPTPNPHSQFAMVAHANGVSGTKKKIEAFKKIGLWLPE